MILRQNVPKLNSRNILWTAASFLLSVSLVKNDCQRSKNYCCSPRRICTSSLWGDRCEFFRGRVQNHEGYSKCRHAHFSTSPNSWALLIQSPSSNSTIELEVEKTFRLEYEDSPLYIHDGSSVYDPLIAVISGRGCDVSVEDLCQLYPKLHVVAKSGSAFIHISTDKKSRKNQFVLRYRSVEPCLSQCSNHQRCSEDKKMCLCMTGWQGRSCNISKCHVQCDNGFCNEKTKKCQCNENFRGQFCKIPTKGGGCGYWSSLISHGQEDIEGRASHAVGLVGSWMWVVGGTVLNEYKRLNNVLRYHVTRNLWEVVKISNTVEHPERSFGHSLVVYKDSLYLFGGDINGHISEELWTFDTITRRWTNLTGSRGNMADPEQPVGVVGHSATLVHNRKMIVLFGYSQNGYHTKVQEYDIVNGTWSVRKIHGRVCGCYGHVAVYEPLTNYIIGHGGYRGIILDDTWMYNPDKQTLKFLSRSPSPRLLHTAVIVGHMMYVQGGITVVDTKQEQTRNFGIKFDAFDLVCCKWKTLTTRGMRDNFGRYGQTAVLHDRTIYVFGGFNGQMLNDVLTYSLENCSLWTEKTKCEESYESTSCRWNSSTESCEFSKEFKVIDECRSGEGYDERCNKGKIKNVTCLQPRMNCDQRRNCEECIGKENSVSNYMKSGTCSWCQSHSRCVNSDERMAVFPYGRCLRWTNDSCEAVTCSSKKTCRDCQTLPGCGWLDNGSGTGLGKCIEGGFSRPKSMDLNSEWFFISCPACQCNGHSRCYSTTECSHCANHTRGSHCQFCTNGYYGDPRNGGLCKVCTCSKKASGTCDHSTGKCRCLAKGVFGHNCSKCEIGYREIKEEGCFFQLKNNFNKDFNLTGKTSVNVVYAPAEHKRDVKLSLNVLAGVHVKMNLTSSCRAGMKKEQKLMTFVKLVKGPRYEYPLTQKTFKFGPPDYLRFKVYIFNVTGSVVLRIHFYQPQFPQIDLLTYVLATFFGCFIAVLFVIALAWRIRSRYMNFIRSRQRRVKRKQMASRPFGKVNILIDHPKNSPLKSNANPIAVEHCEARQRNRGSVTTFIMRFPSDKNGVTPVGQSGICFASVLVVHNLETAKHAGHGNVSKRKKAKKTPVTTWV